MLENKVALITGAAQGIGYGVSVAFANAGANVVLTDYQPTVVEVAQSLNGQASGTVIGLVMDVTKDDSIDAALSQVMTQFGRLDYVINNAGGGVLKPFAELTNEDFDKTVGLDLVGTFKCMRAEINLFLCDNPFVVVR